MSNINKAQVNGTNRTKSTISFWVKRGTLGADQKIFQFKYGSAEYLMKFKSNDQIHLYSYNGSSYIGRIETNRVFRDPAAWYHFHIQVDTTDATAGNRFRFYVNGEQETSLLNSTTPSQDATFEVSTSNHHLYIGSQSDGGDAFAGSFTHFHYTDGYSYAPTVFGETDSTSAIWVPKTAPSVTYGTNGFFLKFENSANMDLDSSGNNLTFTTSGTITQNIDTPTNNFITINPLDNTFSSNSFANGNTAFTTGGNYSYCQSTIYLDTGKWYWECKPVSKTGGGEEYMIGIQGKSVTATNSPAQSNNGYTIYANDGQVYGWGATASYGSAYTAGDIIGVALDCTNNKIYWSKNGTFMGSGDPASGSNGYSINAANTASQGGYSPVAGFYASNNAVFNFNFGNGYFGTTAVSSANADGNGVGAFEYSVPSGYYAICSENIKEFG